MRFAELRLGGWAAKQTWYCGETNLRDDRQTPMSKHQKSRSSEACRKTIFVTVLGGVAEVDTETVPRDIDVEIIDIDDLKADDDAAAELSRKARAYAKKNGYL